MDVISSYAIDTQECACPFVNQFNSINLLVTQRLKWKLMLKGNSVSAERKRLLHLIQRRPLSLPLTLNVPFTFLPHSSRSLCICAAHLQENIHAVLHCTQPLSGEEMQFVHTNFSSPTCSLFRGDKLTFYRAKADVWAVEMRGTNG